MNLYYHGPKGGTKVFRIVKGTSGETRTEVAPRLDTVNHSPTGLSWGYGGSGPAQCALAIVADFLRYTKEEGLRQAGPDDDRAADVLHQDFKWIFIAKAEQNDDLLLTGDEILAWFHAIDYPDFRTANASRP